MKPERDVRLALVKSDIWQDSESFRSGDKSNTRNLINIFDEHPHSDTMRYEDEEEKGDVYSHFIDSLNNGSENDILATLKEYKVDIDFSFQSVFINLLLLYERYPAYPKVKEFFENNAGNEFLSKTSQLQELPEKVEELMECHKSEKK
jgi:hypothetical protein